MLLDKIQAIYERSRVKIKVEPRSTFTFTPVHFSYILSTYVNFTRVNSRKNFTTVETPPKVVVTLFVIGYFN